MAKIRIEVDEEAIINSLKDKLKNGLNNKHEFLSEFMIFIKHLMNSNEIRQHYLSTIYNLVNENYPTLDYDNEATYYMKGDELYHYRANRDKTLEAFANAEGYLPVEIVSFDKYSSQAYEISIKIIDDDGHQDLVTYKVDKRLIFKATDIIPDGNN